MSMSMRPDFTVVRMYFPFTTRRGFAQALASEKNPSYPSVAVVLCWAAGYIGLPSNAGVELKSSLVPFHSFDEFHFAPFFFSSSKGLNRAGFFIYWEFYAGKKWRKCSAGFFACNL